LSIEHILKEEGFLLQGEKQKPVLMNGCVLRAQTRFNLFSNHIDDKYQIRFTETSNPRDKAKARRRK